MSQKLQDLNAKVENLRSQLALLVADKNAVDVEEGYRLLRELNETQTERDVWAHRDLEVAEALNVLRTYGVVFKVWGEKELREYVDTLPNLIEGDCEKIVEHIVEGDDWAGMAEVTDNEEQQLWGMIHGTAHDHPEWFSAEALQKL